MPVKHSGFHERTRIRMKNLRKIILCALFIALNIILVRFLPIYKSAVMYIDLGFLSLALCSALFGPLWGAATALIAEFTGSVLFPIGTYFFGFTLNYGLIALTYGLFFKNSSDLKSLYLRTIGAAVVNELVINLLLGTFWIAVITTTGNVFALSPDTWQKFPVLLASRAAKAPIMIAIQLLILPYFIQISKKAYRTKA